MVYILFNSIKDRNKFRFCLLGVYILITAKTGTQITVRRNVNCYKFKIEGWKTKGQASALESNVGPDREQMGWLGEDGMSWSEG